MHSSPAWNLDQTRLLTRRELAAVLADNATKAKHRKTAGGIWSSFGCRAAAACASRKSPLCRLDDVIVGVSRPYLRLRGETTKGHKPRRVPLWWDAGTLADLVAWKNHRIKGGRPWS